MTTKQAPAPRPNLYEQTIALQDQLVRRGVIAHRKHDIADDSYYTVVGTTIVHCTCGTWIDSPDAEAQRRYSDHALNALRVTLGLAA